MRNRTKAMVRCALFAALMAVCAWIAIPVPPVAVTLQSFAVLLALALLGGRQGTAAIAVYLAVGLVGMPVFAGFRGGAGALLDASGGFLWGFLAGGCVYRALERLGRLPAMAGCMAAVYLCGSFWFCRYAAVSAGQAVLVCVVPFLIPDVVKLWLAWIISGRIGRRLAE